MKFTPDIILQALIDPDSVEPEVLVAIREAFIQASQINTVEID